MQSIISPLRQKVATPAQQSDLLRDAIDAYDAQQDRQLQYRELALGRTFKQRFGVTPEPARFHQRTSLSKSGVWTFEAAGLCWRAGEDGDGDTRRIWYSVLTVDNGWEEASTKEQLGQLVRRGVQFEQAS